MPHYDPIGKQVRQTTRHDPGAAFRVDDPSVQARTEGAQPPHPLPGADERAFGHLGRQFSHFPFSRIPSQKQM